MDLHTRAFLTAVDSGEAVYITDVRRKYQELADGESFVLDLRVEGLDGNWKTLSLRLPRFARFSDAEKRFALDFFLAEMYNILSIMGGRRAVLHNPGGAEEAGILVDAFEREFAPGLPAVERIGYGKCLNILERLYRALDSGTRGGSPRFNIEVSRESAPGDADVSSRKGPGASEVFRRAASGLAGKAILGIDAGGTDIKLALALDGRLAALKEFDWHPASFTRVDEMVEPILSLARLMGDAAGGAGFRFDAIGMSFPDVVVQDKIVDGETPKTRGIREAMGSGMDQAFAALSNLDLALAGLVREGGGVGIINDGPMAAFAAGVEAAASGGELDDGLLSYALGTDLGAGRVDGQGCVPAVPLIACNCIVDLGSRGGRAFPPDDVRSTNNFTSLLPGTAQKYACQSGVFRLAVERFSARRPDIMRDIRAAGFVEERGGGLFVPDRPKDRRKPFLEYLMDLAERDEEAGLAFEDAGKALAAVDEEIGWILGPAAGKRMLFGRVVKRPACFARIRKGAAALSPECARRLAVADEGLARTPLMRELAESREYSVAQFAQAVGAVYYGNCRMAAGG